MICCDLFIITNAYLLYLYCVHNIAIGVLYLAIVVRAIIMRCISTVFTLAAVFKFLASFSAGIQKINYMAKFKQLFCQSSLLMLILRWLLWTVHILLFIAKNVKFFWTSSPICIIYNINRNPSFHSPLWNIKNACHEKMLAVPHTK